jgi:hypothetical protein
MSYNFLGLVNDVCGRVNETPLTSGNFTAANGFYYTAKEAVNSAIRFINQHEFEWPFNNIREDETLSPGVVRYDYPIGAKTVDFESFRVQRNNTFGNETVVLTKIDYEEYLQRGYVDAEYNTSDTSIRQVPRFVFQTPDLNYGVYPPPDQEYILSFEYYLLPVDLALSTDVPSIPADFKHVIVDGAMYYVYFFRGDIETADRVYQKFQDGIKNMRTLYINRYDKIRDGRIPERSYPYTLRVY